MHTRIGGTSSFSIGGYGGASAYHDPVRKRGSGGASKYDNSHNDYAHGRAWDNGRGHDPGEVNAALHDEQAIPGLPNNYREMLRSKLRPVVSDERENSNYENKIDSYSGSRRGQSGTLTSQEYAAQLKAQIDEKKSIRHGGGTGRDRVESYANFIEQQAQGQYGRRYREPMERLQSNGRRSSRPMITNGMDSNMAAVRTVSTSTRVRQQPGGNSSLSLGWN